MAGNPLASLPGLPQRPSLARSSASETRLTQPGIEGERSRKLNSAPTAAFRINGWIISAEERGTIRLRAEVIRAAAEEALVEDPDSVATFDVRSFARRILHLA